MIRALPPALFALALLGASPAVHASVAIDRVGSAGIPGGVSVVAVAHGGGRGAVAGVAVAVTIGAVDAVAVGVDLVAVGIRRAGVDQLISRVTFVGIEAAVAVKVLQHFTG